jgi:hypothetical protein
MARPGHVPEPTWARCETQTAVALGQAPGGASPDAVTGLVASGSDHMDVGVAGASVIGVLGSAVTAAMAPDKTTADAWSWNHTMKSCLQDSGISLP